MLSRGNKYHARKTYSNLIGRTFDSKLECERAEQLRYMELAGEIKDLEFQIGYRLCKYPPIRVTIDFKYSIPFTSSSGAYLYWDTVYEDAKGVLTRDTRTKLAWLKEKYGIDVILYKGE